MFQISGCKGSPFLCVKQIKCTKTIHLCTKYAFCAMATIIVMVTKVARTTPIVG